MRVKPKFGQNFLVDDAARHRIVDALGGLSDRTVVEIGPGHGAITSILAGRCRRLIAVELDPVLASELRVQYGSQPTVEIVPADILRTDLRALIPTNTADDGSNVTPQADVIGNLPYYITSDILLHLFSAAREGLLGRAVLMMQREVAERIAAAPGVREYGLLSATTQMYAGVENLFTLPPSAFSPPPDVYSTVVRLEFRPRFAELGVEPGEFDRFLKACFAQKRKTLANNLRFAGYTATQVNAAWPPSLPAQVRAESAGLELLAELYRGLRRAD
ncbi:MAG: 16S rRNA (adenine(1518)-N(6)/adenine(1519)-N(6)) -dimethyltransferase RsmA [Acidobacteriaceae bacterium]